MVGVRKMVVLCGCFVLLMASVQTASATTWAQRPPVMWVKSSDGKFEAKWITKTGELTVYAMGKRDAPLWSAKLSEYHSIFSAVRLADGGKYIVHIRGNMQAAQLDATAVEIISQGEAAKAPGKVGIQPRPLIVTKTKVKIFIDKLKRLGGRANGGMVIQIAGGPQARWLQRVNKVTDTTLILTNADGVEKTLDLATGKLKVVDDDAKKKDPDKAKKKKKEAAAEKKKASKGRIPRAGEGEKRPPLRINIQDIQGGVNHGKPGAD